MSIEALTWCKKIKGITPTQKLCLTWLCNYAQQDYCAWATEKHLADICNVSDRTIRRVLKKLQDKQFIKIIKKFDSSGRQIRNDYKINVSDVQDSRTPMSTSPQTQMSTLKENNKINIYKEEEFEKIWKIYPRKENKHKALVSWKRICKQIKAEDLLESTEKWLLYHKNINTDLKFIPHFVTYLNNKRWTDVTDKSSSPKSKTEIAG